MIFFHRYIGIILLKIRRFALYRFDNTSSLVVVTSIIEDHTVELCNKDFFHTFQTKRYFTSLHNYLK